MVKDFQKQFNRLHILLDALVIGGSYFLAWYILFGLYHEKVGRLSFAIYMRALILIVPLYLLLMRSSGCMRRSGPGGGGQSLPES